jgi:hypothetical protein
MEAFKVQLEESLKEFRALKDGATFNPRKLLEAYGNEILKLAKAFPEEPPHTIQDNRPYEPGMPVTWTATK